MVAANIAPGSNIAALACRWASDGMGLLGGDSRDGAQNAAWMARSFGNRNWPGMRLAELRRLSGRYYPTLFIQPDGLPCLGRLLCGKTHLDRPQPIVQPNLDTALPSHDIGKAIMLIKG